MDRTGYEPDAATPALERAEHLVATWVRDGGLTYRELVIALWRLGDCGDYCSQIADEHLKV